MKTSNGNITIDEVTSGVVRLITSIGTIEVGVRPGTAANLDVRTKLGRVRNFLNSIETPDAYSSSVKVRARTSLGDVVVRQAEQPDGINAA